MSETRSAPVREWAIVAATYASLVLIAAVRLALDRRPPEWWSGPDITPGAIRISAKP